MNQTQIVKVEKEIERYVGKYGSTQKTWWHVYVNGKLLFSGHGSKKDAINYATAKAALV